LHLSVFGLKVGNPFLEGVHWYIVNLFSIFSKNPHWCYFWLVFSCKIE
jgi:hypothetical protein